MLIIHKKAWKSERVSFLFKFYKRKRGNKCKIEKWSPDIFIFTLCHTCDIVATSKQIDFIKVSFLDKWTIQHIIKFNRILT